MSEIVSSSNISVQDGARIKVWPGVSSALSTDLQGGGGSGLVKNITYDGMTIDNVDYAIEVTQCYGQKNLTLCNEFPVGVPRCYLAPVHLDYARSLRLGLSCRQLTFSYFTEQASD
jgi:hypothetical protein